MTQEIATPNQPTMKERTAYWLQKTVKYFQMTAANMQDFQEAWNKAMETIGEQFKEYEAEIKRLKEENADLKKLMYGDKKDAKTK